MDLTTSDVREKANEFYERACNAGDKYAFARVFKENEKWVNENLINREDRLEAHNLLEAYLDFFIEMLVERQEIESGGSDKRLR